MTTGDLLVERSRNDQGVVIVTLNRSARANAYTTTTLSELLALVHGGAGNQSIRAMVLTGAGNAFCGGADRSELDSRDEADAFALMSRDVFDALSAAPWPVVAAVNGPAVGGGFELALAADLRVCGPNALFRLPEVSLGLIPAAGGIRRLVEEVGSARAKELVMFGQTIDAFTAAQWGIVSEVVSDPLAVATRQAELAAIRDQTCMACAKSLINERSGALSGRAPEAIAQALLYGRRRRLAQL